MTEASLYKPILHYLALKRIEAWRNNTGAVQAEHNGHKRFIRYGRKGQADITGIMRDGRRLEIEVKTEKGKITDDQAEFIEMIRWNNGVALVVYGLDDAMRKIDAAVKGESK